MVSRKELARADAERAAPAWLRLLLVATFFEARKSSGHCVVKVTNVAHLLDLSLVQTYLINGDKAVFLNPRPMSEQGKPGYQKCHRGLQDAACLFCSLKCKLEGIDGDFSEPFAVHPKSDSESGEESESDDDDSSRLTKFRKLENHIRVWAGCC
ncbi:uncharacterized protein LOC133923234 [Phragmites australis]|uniref:uncharacterized protein LOC133923234 n=1 Tax=Phragmites australis TaxID=29695 RepID=UPI002D76A576|nr:uncharacterized protein LOC133923234 [Phragmites australis]